ncbi:MAG TPA: non-ribosomal peptide synthetase [Candidatus Paceibacterota bacterium]|nr:non-ribosomal peptide synthetase [Candidatus Paceibacterota bacterium]
MTERINIADELLRENLVRRGAQSAIYHGQSRITFLELAANTRQFGRFFLDLGLRRRDRIVIQLPDRPECIYAFLGGIQAGLWPILVNPELSHEARNHIVSDSGATALVTDRAQADAEACTTSLRLRLNIDDDQFRHGVRAASPELDPHLAHPDDIAFFLYSSGSTGHPKGVPHRHKDMLFCADSYGANVLKITERDRHFSASKLFFAYGLGNSLFLPFRFGASTVLFSDKPAPGDILRIIARHRPTIFFGVPALYSMLVKTLDDSAELDSLRLCVSAGEALPAAIVRDWQRLTGVEVLDGIGSTEALHIFISNFPGRIRPGSSGSVVPPYEATLASEGGSPVAPGQLGSLLIRGGSTAAYYWNQPTKTAQTMLQDGWLKTGDIYVEEDGYYAYQGREDDMFKVDARWVSPIQVEEVLRRHQAVRDCAVTWRKLEGLVRPMAFVIVNEGFAADSNLEKGLRLFAREKLPEHMCPVQIQFRETLPRTDTGKIQRFRLRQTGLGDAPKNVIEPGASTTTIHSATSKGKLMQVTSADILSVMKEAGIQQSLLNQLKPDVPLLNQGLDSIDLPAVAAATERRFHIDLSDADARELMTVNDYVRFLNRKLE